MKKIMSTILCSVISTICLLCLGCTKIILPYEEEPLCKKGAAGGYCGTVSEVYDAVSDDIDQKKRIQKNGVKGVRQ